MTRSRPDESAAVELARRRGRRRRIYHSVMISGHVAWLPIRCRPRPFGQHGGIPRIPVVLETLENIFVPDLEIGPLARVLDDIEQKLVARNQQILPVAVAHRALPASLEAPEQLARMGRRTTSQHWQQVLAVRRIGGIHLRP